MTEAKSVAARTYVGGLSLGLRLLIIDQAPGLMLIFEDEIILYRYLSL